MSTKRVPADQLEYSEDGLYYLNEKPFTGIAFYSTEEGWIQAEKEYQQGLLSGTSRDWFGPNAVERETHCAWGVRHGLHREWYPGGWLAAEENYEYGIRTHGKRWSEDGQLTEDYQLTEDEPIFETLKLSRAAFEKRKPKKRPPKT